MKFITILLLNAIIIIGQLNADEKDCVKVFSQQGNVYLGYLVKSEDEKIHLKTEHGDIYVNKSDISIQTKVKCPPEIKAIELNEAEIEKWLQNSKAVTGLLIKYEADFDRVDAMPKSTKLQKDEHLKAVTKMLAKISKELKGKKLDVRVQNTGVKEQTRLSKFGRKQLNKVKKKTGMNSSLAAFALMGCTKCIENTGRYEATYEIAIPQIKKDGFGPKYGVLKITHWRDIDKAEDKMAKAAELIRHINDGDEDKIVLKVKITRVLKNKQDALKINKDQEYHLKTTIREFNITESVEIVVD